MSYISMAAVEDNAILNAQIQSMKAKGVRNLCVDETNHTVICASQANKKAFFEQYGSKAKILFFGHNGNYYFGMAAG